MRERLTPRSRWHLRAGSVVVGWLAALLVVTLVHPFVPASRWLLVHLLVLGAVSNAILIWSWHFAAALLRLPEDVMRRGQVRRLVLFNLGAVAVVVGVVASAWPLVLLGGLLVAGTALWHSLALLVRLRAALPSRFGVTVRYYVAAGVALPVGVVLGVLMARGGLSDAAHARAVTAHALVNLFGWVGLTVVGTLVTLWPTMLRTRVADGTERVARRVLPLMAGALAFAVAGAVAGILVLAGAGLLAYAAGLVVLFVPHAEELRRKAPVAFSTLSVLAGVTWLLGSVLVLGVGLLTAPNWATAGDRASAVTAPLLVGFAAQVLLGALAYLVPVVLGGGPSVLRTTTAELDRAGTARVVATNLGLLLCLLPVPSLVRVLVSMVVLAALASFLPLVVRAVLATRRGAAGPAGVTRSRVRDVPTDSPQRRVALAAAGVSAVVLATAGGVAMDPAAAGVPVATAAAEDVVETGETTRVEVRIEGMRFVPEAVEVPAGNRLVIDLVNTGEDTHDLVLETGARTPRLAPGEHATLDAGVIGAGVDGWCSVAGHRQMGMVLQVEVAGSAAGHDTDGNRLEDEVAPDFEARDAALAPAPSAAVHEVTLTVQEVEREVAPGVTQTLWTFNGTAPGPTLRGKVGDVFEVTLVNDGSIGHSIDFHAGALAPDRPMRTIQPGKSLTYRFTAERAGMWMYHCSTTPMSLHIANGMFGAVIIDPPDLPAVDREYVLVQSELYLGAQGEAADMETVLAERPGLVVFNGYANQYDRDPLPARAGERVRLWVLAAGPQRGSAFHVVGGQFDSVWQEGAYRLPPGTAGGAQVLGLHPAQGGFVELTFPEAGSYPFVTHAMVDAERGAHGVFEVSP